MPRIPRKFIQTSFLHIMTQGINKSCIFSKEEDIKYYIKLMYKLKKEYKLNIIAYCIMNNHAHFLIQIEKIEELSKFMQRLNLQYGLYFNKKYNRVGFVFRNRYKSEGIFSEEHLYNCIKYIYDNPVKAGICKEAYEYPYSNYKELNIQTDMNYVYMETDEERGKEVKEIIDRFCEKNAIKKDELKEHKKELKELIHLLKDEYKISLRQISAILDIGREKIRMMYKESVI